jgi:diaminohydroxyphosphoribosylaminopyrimidine deaminase/5-amino-6-(5-phosphoribosylamino)uracil reductase
MSLLQKTESASQPDDLRHLRHAARLALRGHGGAEPNPLVGCVIVSPAGRVVGWGYHRQCGQAHAERVALARAGDAAAGATAYVTLEPCSHTGRTPPCTDALVAAKVARVVMARKDPNPIAAGGAAQLAAAGIRVDYCDDCREAVEVSDAFVQRIRSGLPWVVAKWAQTIDGRIATREGESKWISSPASRALLHRERGRVDVILTGIGTVLRDDPTLTARRVRLRRAARRVLIDPKLEIPLESRLLSTILLAPLTIACHESAIVNEAAKMRQLHGMGVEIIPLSGSPLAMPLAPLLRELVVRHEAATVLVESGGGLLGRLFEQRMVNEAWVFVAPLLFGDDQAMGCVRGLTVRRLTDGQELSLRSIRRRADDVILRYRVMRPRL